MREKRGLIGPLGDDIPSIFPITVGVLLFLTTIVYAGIQFDEKEKLLSLRKAGLGLSYLATAQGFTDTVAFTRNCNSTWTPYASAQSVDFAVTVKEFCGGPIDLSNYEPLSIDPDKGELSCSSRPVIKTQGRPSPESPTNAFILNYPIATRCPGSAFGPGLINILVWRKKG
jgi:hypothetical protein